MVFWRSKSDQLTASGDKPSPAEDADFSAPARQEEFAVQESETAVTAASSAIDSVRKEKAAVSTGVAAERSAFETSKSLSCEMKAPSLSAGQACVSGSDGFVEKETGKQENGEHREQRNCVMKEQIYSETKEQENSETKKKENSETKEQRNSEAKMQENPERKEQENSEIKKANSEVKEQENSETKEPRNLEARKKKSDEICRGKNGDLAERKNSERGKQKTGETTGRAVGDPGEQKGGKRQLKARQKKEKKSVLPPRTTAVRGEQSTGGPVEAVPPSSETPGVHVPKLLNFWKELVRRVVEATESEGSAEEKISRIREICGAAPTARNTLGVPGNKRTPTRRPGPTSEGRQGERSHLSTSLVFKNTSGSQGQRKTAKPKLLIPQPPGGLPPKVVTPSARIQRSRLVPVLSNSGFPEAQNSLLQQQKRSWVPGAFNAQLATEYRQLLDQHAAGRAPNFFALQQQQQQLPRNPPASGGGDVMRAVSRTSALPLSSSPWESDHPVCIRIREGLRVASDADSLQLLIQQAVEHKIMDLAERGRKKLEKLVGSKTCHEQSDAPPKPASQESDVDGH